MKANSDLYFLVQSLDPESRKAFRKVVRQKQTRGPSLYLRLFDVLAGQEEFDEFQTKSHFKGESCLKQFTRIKNYLYEQLLAFLAREKVTGTAAGRVRTHLAEARMLQRQGLYGQALKRLSRARALVDRYAFTVDRPKTLALERELHKRRGGKDLADHLQRLDQEERQALLHLQTETLARQAYDQELLLARQRPGAEAPPPGVPAPIDAPDPHAPFNAQLAIHLRAALNLRQRQQRKAAHRHYRAAFQLWQDNPHQIREFPGRFFRLTSAYLSSGHSIGEYEGFAPWLEHLQNDQALSEPLRDNLLCMSYNLQLLFHLNQQQMDEAHELVPGLTQVLESTNPRLSSWLPAATNLAVLHFTTGNYPHARRWIDQILDLPRGTERTDLRELARILHLIVLHEAGDRELIPYAWRSTERFIRKHRPLNPLETALGTFFRKTDQAITAQDEQVALKKLRLELEAMGEDKRQTGLEEVRLWASQKCRPETE